jgi:hypothetical protein
MGVKLSACAMGNAQVARQIGGMRSLGITELAADTSNGKIEVAEIESPKQGGNYP